MAGDMGSRVILRILVKSVSPFPKDLNLQITHTSAQSPVSGALGQKTCLHERVVL